MIISVDFDGVIHRYDSGWQGIDTIPDPPVEGSFDFLQELNEHAQVAIYSSRSASDKGRNAMREWMIKHGLSKDFVYEELSFPEDKPPAQVSIDDRAVRFEGTFPSIDDLLEFEPWHT